MRPLRVFIVDDDRDLAESRLEILMEVQGIEVVRAASGEEAVEKFRGDRFDLSLVDLKLPGMNGLDCLRALRRKSPEARVVMMTGYGVPDFFDQVVESGALDLLDRPLVVDDLMTMLTNMRMETSSEDNRDRR